MRHQISKLWKIGLTKVCRSSKKTSPVTPMGRHAPALLDVNIGRLPKRALYRSASVWRASWALARWRLCRANVVATTAIGDCVAYPMIILRQQHNAHSSPDVFIFAEQSFSCAASSMQEKDRDCGDNAQRDEDEQRDPHANREAVGERGLTGWDSHKPREPFVEFHSIPLFRIRRTLVPSEDLLNTQAVFQAHDSPQGDLSERYPRPQPGRCPNFSRWLDRS